MKRLLPLLLVLAAFVAPQPVTAQGSGIGTLPHRSTASFARPVAWLSAYSTVTDQSDAGGARLYYSSHNGEDLANVPPADAGIKEVTWRSRHSTFHLVCPEWLSEVEDTVNGASHWEARFAAEVTEAQMHFPPDGT